MGHNNINMKTIRKGDSRNLLSILTKLSVEYNNDTEDESIEYCCKSSITLKNDLPNLTPDHLNISHFTLKCIRYYVDILINTLYQQLQNLEISVSFQIWKILMNVYKI